MTSDRSDAAASASEPMSAEARLQALGVELITPGPAPGFVIRVKRSGPWLFLSGQGPAAIDGRRPAGKVGRDLTPEEGYDAARTVGLGLLGTIRNALGSLDRVTSVVKVTSFVNCEPGFDQLSQVSNGCSDLFVAVFGETVGRHTRSAVGVAELPNRYPVEIEAIVEVMD